MFRKKDSSLQESRGGSRKVLILGSGFGGIYALRQLIRGHARNENLEITIINDENYFLFSPLLCEVAMGSIETRHVAYPIRRLLSKNLFTFVQASVEDIDINSRQVTTTAGNFNFDYLVLALGCVPLESEPYSSETEKGNVFHLRTLRDSMAIRNHIIETFEQASNEQDPERQKQLLTFVVAGAGYIGVQAVTALQSFVFRELTSLYSRIATDNVRIILIEAESEILAQSHPKFRRYAARYLHDIGIEVKLESKITDIQADRVEINNSETIPTNTVLWVTGVIANPRIANLDVEKDSIGRVLVNERLEVPGFPGVFAVGDCAHFEDPRSGQPIPPRAHTTVRQAKIAAHNILADVRGIDKKKPYCYSNPFDIVTLGPSRGLFSFHNLRIYGFLARFIWMSGFSLLIWGSFNRIRIIMDWLLSLIFGRDTTLLKQIE